MDDGKHAGEHFDPAHAKKHGGLKDHNCHAGDLGNILADMSGNASFNFEIEKLRILGGTDHDNILGRSIMIHTHEDDLGLGGSDESLKTGNVGQHVSMGVIGVSGPLSH